MVVKGGCGVVFDLSDSWKNINFGSDLGESDFPDVPSVSECLGNSSSFFVP